MVKRGLFFTYLLFSMLFFGTLGAEEASSASEDLLCQRIYAHLKLKDTSSALAEAMNGVAQYPQSSTLYAALIKVYADRKDDKKMLSTWHKYTTLFPEKKNHNALIEEMAWSILEKGVSSSSPIIRLHSLVGAFFANDIRSAHLIRAHMEDPNALIRSVNLQLAARLGDTILKEGVLQRFRKERNWHVRLESISAIGALKLTEAHNELLSLISNDKTPAEEKALGIQALVDMQDTAQEEEVIYLATSNRMGLRLLACEIVANFELYDYIDHIIPLLKDPSHEVRLTAVQVLGLFRKYIQEHPIAAFVTPLLNDTDPKVSIAAAWVLTLNPETQKHGQELLSRWLEHEKQDMRLLAAGALVSCGKYGFPLISQAFHRSQDPYVRLNLALGLINQRQDIEDACVALSQEVQNNKENWMEKTNGLFKYIAPSNLRHNPDIPQYPKLENQQVRLEILSTLAILKRPEAKSLLKDFLREQSWGITTFASAVLLTECDDSALDLVRTLLNDPDPQIQLQAALVLALWGRDESAIETLQKSYRQANREMQERILEGLGHIGDISCAPFLTGILSDNHQSLRIMAATALIQCLNK